MDHGHDDDYGLRLFALSEAPALVTIRERLEALRQSELTAQQAQIAARMRDALPLHTATLREAIEKREPGLAARIDAGTTEIRQAKRVLPHLRSTDQRTATLCEAYVYWAYSADVRGAGGLSDTAIRRQYAVYSRKHPLQCSMPCPACDEDAWLQLLSANFDRGVDMQLHCVACGHQTERKWFQMGDDMQRLKCPCARCKGIVQQAAADIAPLAHGLGSALARFALDAAEREVLRLRSLPAAPPRPLSHGANVALALASAAGPEAACSDALKDRRFRHPWDRYDANIALLDELIAQREVEVETDWLVSPGDDAMVLQCVFLTRPYLSRPTEQLGRSITVLLTGFAAQDDAAFRSWLQALTELAALTHYFYLPMGFLYTWAETSPLRGGAPAREKPKAELTDPAEERVPGYVVLHVRETFSNEPMPVSVRPAHIAAFGPIRGAPHLTMVTLGPASEPLPQEYDAQEPEKLVVIEPYHEVARRIRVALDEEAREAGDRRH